MNEVLVTRKGQITVPIAIRRKYGIKEGMTVTVEDSGSQIILKVIPKSMGKAIAEQNKFNSGVKS